MSTLRIRYKDPNQLKSGSRLARTHDRRQIKQIAASINQFGFVSPVLIDKSDSIIAGHGRVAAAKLIGARDIPTVCIDHLTPAQVRAYVIADNRLAELAGWDRKLLALELQELSIQLDFDVTVTGFETADVDILINELQETSRSDADNSPEIDRTTQPISLLGDVWKIGDHRLLCGSALERSSYELLLGNAKAQIVVTDPPFNLTIARILRTPSAKRREFAMASGEMTEHEYCRFLTKTLKNLCAATSNGSIHFVFIDWRHVRDLLNAAVNSYTELKNICVWSKNNAGMGSLYRSEHELVCVFKNGAAPHVNNVELGRFGRDRSNVWRYDRPISFGRSQETDIDHPTIKPTALIADAIMDCSNRRDAVLDAFVGSGSTFVAAERTGRICFGIEIDPHYVDATLKRLRDSYGLAAVHLQTNKTFEQIARERSRR